MTPPPPGREPTGPDADGSNGPGRPAGARPGDGGGPADPDATTWLRADAISGGPVPGADPDPSPVLAPPADPSGDEKHDPSLNKLSKTLQKGAAISAVVLVATQVLSLVQAVVTARLLSPIEIGAFTLGTTFCNYLTTLAGGGMKAALIQRGKDVEDAANTAFWASLASGVVMGGIAFATAPLLGALFPDPRIPPGLVTMIAAITCGTLLVHALLNVPEALMQRQFNFKRKLIVDPLTSISFTIVAIAGAVAGWGVWALVAALYASQISTLIASWTLARWFPGKGRFKYRIWREMAQFSFPLILQGVSAQIRDSAQPTIVGRLLGADPVGQFRYGKRIGVLPGNAIIQIASYVLFPAFSRIADDAVRFRRGFLRALRLLWTVTLPLGVLLAAVGGPAIVVLLGPEWAPAGVFVAAMAGFGPGTAMNAVSVESIKGAGRSRLIHWVTGTSLVVGLGGLVLFIALGMGLLGVGLAVSLEALAAGALTLALARPIVGATWGELGRTMVPPIFAALAAGAATAALEHLVLHSATRSIPVGLLFLVLDSLAFAGVYVAIMLVVAPATIREIVDLLSKFRRRGSGGEEAPAAVGDTPDGPQDLVGARDRRGEDYLLDAPTIVLALWSDPETQRLGSYPPPAPRRPAGPPPPPRPGPPPGPGAPGPAPFAPPRDGLPEDARPTEAMRTTERRPAPPEGARPPGAPPAPVNGHDRHGHATNGHPPNGHVANGHATNGHATNGHATNGHTDGHPSNGHAPDGSDAPEPAGAAGARGGGKATGRRRRMVPMTQKPPRRPRR